jgi:hypothetical protein
MYRITFTLLGREQQEVGTRATVQAIADWLVGTYRVASRIERLP